jgi:hypothetical protein
MNIFFFNSVYLAQEHQRAGWGLPTFFEEQTGDPSKSWWSIWSVKPVCTCEFGRTRVWSGCIASQTCCPQVGYFRRQIFLGELRCSWYCETLGFPFFGPTFYHAFSLLVCLLSHFITIIWSWMNPLRLDCQLEKFPQIFAILFMLEVSKYLVSSLPWIFAILWTPSSLWWSWFCCSSRWFSVSALRFLLRILWCSQISVIIQRIL